MMRKSSPSPADERPRSGPAPVRARHDADAELEKALDTLAASIRLLGEHPLATGAPAEVQQACDKWARHVLIVGPRPQDPPDSRGLAERDWPGLLAFLTRLRRGESEAVGRSVTTLRATLSDFLTGIRSIVTEDGRAERDVEAQIERLKAAMHCEDLDQLRSEVASVSGSLTSVMEARKKAQQSLMQELKGRVKDLSNELEDARRDAQHDALTKVANRLAFDNYASRVVGLDGLFGKAACLLMVDIDHFKTINDTFGHPTGDDVLRKLGDALTRTFPRKTDFVARYGGEEFAVVLRDTNLREAAVPAGRRLAAARGVGIARDGGWHISVSVGVAELKSGEAVADWIARADAALYRAKNEGRDRVVEALP